MVLASYLSNYVRVVDIILAFIILWGAYKGYRKGFLMELLSISAFMTGVILIFYLLGLIFISAEESELVGEVPKSLVFGMFFLLYILGVIALNYFGRKIQKKIDYSILDDFDNTAAFILGGLKYAVSLAIFLGMLDSAGLRMDDEVTADSFLYLALLDFQDWLVEIGGIIAPSLGETADEIARIFKQGSFKK